MGIFNCEMCNYSTTINSNYHKHLRTKKHQKMCETKENETLNKTNIHNTQKYPKKGKKSIQKDYVCDDCQKGFTTKAHLNRHVNHNCPGPNNSDQLLDIIKKQNKTIEDMYNQHQQEKQVLFNKMDILLEHIGDTTNNITNNKIILNCYGSEDYSHITDTYKNMLLKIPYAMIPKFIEELHFKNPENNNICIPNKKEPFLKVYTDNKWVFKDKKSIIREMVDKNFNYLDSYYNTIGYETLDDTQKKRYTDFQHLIKDDKSETSGKVTKETELLLLNKDLTK
jgi:hypothetical protein